MKAMPLALCQSIVHSMVVNRLSAGAGIVDCVTPAGGATPCGPWFHCCSAAATSLQ
jgi:hypothetical protein